MACADLVVDPGGGHPDERAHISHVAKRNISVSFKQWRASLRPARLAASILDKRVQY